MDKPLHHKVTLYQLAVIFSLLFALIGFSYNVWRLEVSEQNSTIRTACFEMLLELSALEQLVYSAHYDKNTIDGSPRKGWVKVGLISDLSLLTSPDIRNTSTGLLDIWSQHWNDMSRNRQSVDTIISAIEKVRSSIKTDLLALE